MCAYIDNNGAHLVHFFFSFSVRQFSYAYNISLILCFCVNLSAKINEYLNIILTNPILFEREMKVIQFTTTGTIVPYYTETSKFFFFFFFFYYYYYFSILVVYDGHKIRFYLFGVKFLLEDTLKTRRTCGK